MTAGTGAGGISSAQSAARSRAIAKGVFFVSTSRVGSGSVSGGSSTAPIFDGDDLLPQKARLLLMLSLAIAPGDAVKVRQLVESLGNPEWNTVPPGNPQN